MNNLNSNLTFSIRNYSYSNTSQLDLWGRGDLGGSQSNQFSSELGQCHHQIWKLLLSKFVSLNLLLILHILKECLKFK